MGFSLLLFFGWGGGPAGGSVGLVPAGKAVAPPAPWVGGLQQDGTLTPVNLCYAPHGTDKVGVKVVVTLGVATREVTLSKLYEFVVFDTTGSKVTAVGGTKAVTGCLTASLTVRGMIGIPQIVDDYLPVSAVSVDFIKSLSGSAVLPTSFTTYMPLFVTAPAFTYTGTKTSFIPSPVVTAGFPTYYSFLVCSVLSSNLTSTVGSSAPTFSTVCFTIGKLSPIAVAIFAPVLHGHSGHS